MPIPFLRLSRSQQSRALKDEAFARDLRQRAQALLLQARQLSDTELLSKLGVLNINLDVSRLEELSRQFSSAEAVLRQLSGNSSGKTADSRAPEDWGWLAVACLWERWLPERPSAELIDDLMQRGYAALDQDDVHKACDLWKQTWHAIGLFMQQRHLGTMEECETALGITEIIVDWVQDYSQSLLDAGREDPSYFPDRLRLCESVLTLTHDSSLIAANERDLAETHLELGHLEIGDRMFEKLMTKDPQWGFVWICWSDCYYLFASPERANPSRAIELLTRGLAVPGVDDQDEMLHRLQTILEETGRRKEAQAVRKQLLRLERNQSQREEEEFLADLPIVSPPSSAAERFELSFPPRPLGPAPLSPTSDDLGLESGAPLRAPERVGRNAPCPCGSGKKFKKCCGARSD
ncbi:MAG: YecA family protein [Planctomycetales bacterium]